MLAVIPHFSSPLTIFCYLFLQLFSSVCPITCDNFLRLCTHSEDVKPRETSLALGHGRVQKAVTVGKMIGFRKSVFTRAQRQYCVAGVCMYDDDDDGDDVLGNLWELLLQSAVCVCVGGCVRVSVSLLKLLLLILMFCFWMSL